MHHKLDIHPIPEEVLYVNDLLLAGKVPYETKDDMEKAVTGKKKSEGGILPDDNVRIYVPMDLNAEGIMWRLYALYGSLGYPTESNESAYYSGVLSWKSMTKCVGQEKKKRALRKQMVA